MLVKKVIQSMTPTGRTDEKGNSSYNIKCVDGTSGLWNGKKLEFWKIGEEVEFELEEKISEKSGKPWNKFSIPKQDNGYRGGGQRSQPKAEKSYEEKQYSKRITALNVAITIFSKMLMEITVKDIMEKLVEYLETKGNTINAQASLKCAEKFLDSELFLNAVMKKTGDENRINYIISQANKFYQNIETI
jgi:hypothetical protein